MTTLSRDLRPGDVVLTAMPFAHMLRRELWGQRCHYCFEKSDSLKRCAGCQTFQYCGKDCQTLDWKVYHKLGECTAYKKAKELGLEGRNSLSDPKCGMQMLLRMYLICAKKSGAMDKKFTLADGGSRSFRDLMTHAEELSKGRFGTEQALVRVTVASQLAPLVPDLDMDLFMECWAKKRINCFSVNAGITEKVGAALYIESSVFDHSCRPNAVDTAIGIRQEIRAIRNIRAGEQICVSYINPCEPRAVRQKKLKNNYFFDCKCNRCEAGDEPDIAAQNEKLEAMIIEINALVARIRHPKDFLIAREAFDLQRKQVELYCKMMGGDYFPHLTVHMFQVVEAAVRMDRQKDDRVFLRRFIPEVREHMLVTHGPEHYMFQKLMKIIKFLQSHGEI